MTVRPDLGDAGSTLDRSCGDAIGVIDDATAWPSHMAATRDSAASLKPDEGAPPATRSPVDTCTS